MAPPPADSENALLDRARTGDDDAFRRLIEPRQGELRAHCYRMLGSIQDAEDALQDALLRAWRGLPRFDGRSSLRTWLYRISTNTCLDAIGRRPSRGLPMDHVRAADPADWHQAPASEAIWLEPIPEELLAAADGHASPEARYEEREGMELAFIAALQHLPARQRAALIMRDVLGFSAKEAADALETGVVSLNSALQRARDAVQERRLPAESQQATLRTLGDDAVRGIVDRYMDAMQRADVDAVVAMLSEDAAWSMPPLVEWYAGHDAITGFLAGHAFTVRWRHLPTRANGQPAVASYAWDETCGLYVGGVLDVLTLRGDRIAAVTSFATEEVFQRLAHDGPPYAVSEIFRLFRLPETLPA